MSEYEGSNNSGTLDSLLKIQYADKPSKPIPSVLPKRRRGMKSLERLRKFLKGK